MPEIQRWFQSRLREIVNVAASRNADLSRSRGFFAAMSQRHRVMAAIAAP
jgi:hypothetical protein